tara:strand:- start:324 stop:902 length:579 start_codon:yes stop_codon:yes gene_type:complete
MLVKICAKCNEVKTLELFKKGFCRWTTKEGVKNRKRTYGKCKDCENAYARQYHVDNIERKRELSRNLYWKDHESTLRKKRKYRKDNEVYTAEYQHNYHENHKEESRENRRKWCKNNPEKRKIVSNRYARKPEVREASLEKSKQSVIDLTDGYVKDLIIKRSDLCRADIPDELVKAKRSHMKITRQLKETGDI